MIAQLLLAATPLVATPPAPPADFLAYVEEVRQAGATETARSELVMVASIMAGTSVFEFRKDPQTGSYYQSYRSTSCPAPGLSAAERQKLFAEITARVEPVLKRLRAFADTDRSGFVSTAEGWEVRRTFEFGAELAALVPQEGTDRATLCKLLHVTPAEFDRRLEAYNALVRWFAGTEVRFLPAVPASFPACDEPASGPR